MRAGSENGGGEHGVDSVAAGGHHVATMVCGPSREPLLWSCAAHAMPTVGTWQRSPGDEQHQPPAPRDASDTREQRSALLGRQLIVAEHHARAPRQPFQRVP